MSLRTKILAAVVGLNLGVLVLAVLVLLLGVSAEGGVPSDLLRLVAAVERDPGDGPEARAARASAVRAVAAARGRVEAVLWLEEDDDPFRRAPAPVATADGPALARADVDRAAALHRRARASGEELLVLDGELVQLLHGARDTVPAPDAAAGPARRQSLYVRWEASGADVGRARVLYFTLLAGLVCVTALAWTLLSRRVVRPLAALADAAAKMAAGDLAARVPTTGTGDEFDRTAHAFNRMATEIAEHQGQLEDRVMQALVRVRKAEQHLVIAERLAATGKLASGIAHEINNPLGGLRNAVRSLQRGDLDRARTTEYLELVADGLVRIEDTVKKVLQFTPRTPNPRPTDLVDVARKAAALARHRVERRGVRLVERLPAGEVRVFGDPHELAQVALNLLLNAGDAVPEREEDGRPRDPGHGVVEIEVATEGESAVLSVRDDGVGMTAEVAARCFDLFFTTKEVGEGTGLGLAVVHNIVTNHGGRIDLETAPGRGTTFRVVLPREASPAAPATAGPGDGAVTGR